MEPFLWCDACSRLQRQTRGGNGCTRCGNPAAALDAVVDVVDAGVFLDSCHPDARLRGSHSAELLLPTVTVRDAGRDCAVCLEELKPGATALVTPCNHTYHQRCIAPWIRARGTCPLCRTHIGAGDRNGLVMCRFDSGRHGLGLRFAGRVFNVRVLDADGNLERFPTPRGFQWMLQHATIVRRRSVAMD